MWRKIETELVPEVVVGGKRMQVEYFLCADLKSLLLNMGYKSANARDVCVYCTCCKSRWELCCKDNKCCVRYVRISDGSYQLQNLRPSDAGFKRPPLVNMSLYKFVITDILHAYLRITDHLFVKSCNLMPPFKLAEFVDVCRHNGIKAFSIRDENGALRFSNLDKRNREKIMKTVFMDRILHTLMPFNRVSDVVDAMTSFVSMWELVSSPEPNVPAMKEAIVTFTRQFRKSFAVKEIPNYVHMLCHLPFLTEQFGPMRQFQQQGVEALNHTINKKVRSVTRPGASQMTQAVQAVNRALWRRK